MPLVITDDELTQAGLSAEEMRLELACRLFEAKRLTFGQARKLSGLPRLDFEDELRDRGITMYFVTPESWQHDLAGLPSARPVP